MPPNPPILVAGVQFARWRQFPQEQSGGVLLRPPGPRLRPQGALPEIQTGVPQGNVLGALEDSRGI